MKGTVTDKEGERGVRWERERRGERRKWGEREERKERERDSLTHGLIPQNVKPILSVVCPLDAILIYDF